ncbi:MAG: NAD(P)-dependent oxidoreductase [Promethearchaeota archaeon]|jgi:phosphoglycerate dehydrogenase-like enzyme
MKVLVVRPRLSDWIAGQKDLLPDNVELITPEKGTEEELIQLARDADIIVCTRLSPVVLKNAKMLKLIQKTGAGVDALPFDAIGDDVFVANTSGANPVPLAEGAISLLLALARRVVQRNKLFPNIDRHRGTELRGKKVGIIGLGNIGIEIAKRLQAFEMKILALKRMKSFDLQNEMNLEFLGGPEDLDYVLTESDFIVVIVPLTPATRGMIGAREIGLIKPSAYLINVARAAIIEEEALYLALKENRIAGAALDVWWIPHWWDPSWKPELTKPSRFPFWELPNVIATPHNIGYADFTKYSEKVVRIIVENIANIANGKPPINQVDKENQY